MAPTFDTLADHDFEIDEDEIDFSGKTCDTPVPRGLLQC